MSDMQANLPKTDLEKGERRVGRLSFGIFAVLLGLFAFIEIEGAVIATGQAVVQGKPRPVQSADGGVVDDIRVTDGDIVAAGDLLVRLDPRLLQVNWDILVTRLTELTARRARLEAEERGRAEIVPQTIDPRIDQVAYAANLAGQIRIFEARRDVLMGQKAQGSERIAQYQRRGEGLVAQIKASEEQTALLQEEIDNLEVLNARGLAPENRLLELQGRRAAEVAKWVTLQADLAANDNAIRDAELEITQSNRSFREQVTTELREAVVTYQELQLELLKVEQQLERLDIRAPVGGVVHEMQLAAAGSVLAPQQTVLTVIPVAQGVEFNLEIAPDAVDSVFPGQEARLRFPAFDQKSTPELWGTIARVSPDAVLDPATGLSFYRVTVSVGATELERLGPRELVPGMPIEAFLQTGERSILSYLMKPLTDQMVRAFREI